MTHANDSILRHRQSDRIERTILSIPPNIPNIATINRQAVSLGPGIIQLSHPVEAELVIVSRLHLLRLVHLQMTGHLYLLGHDFATRVADGAERWLLEAGAVVCGLWLGHVWLLLVDWLGLLGKHGHGHSDWVVDWLLSDLDR